VLSLSLLVLIGSAHGCMFDCFQFKFGFLNFFHREQPDPLSGNLIINKTSPPIACHSAHDYHDNLFVCTKQLSLDYLQHIAGFSETSHQELKASAITFPHLAYILAFWFEAEYPNCTKYLLLPAYKLFGIKPEVPPTSLRPVKAKSVFFDPLKQCRNIVPLASNDECSLWIDLFRRCFNHIH
jgi:hypothetical protein